MNIIIMKEVMDMNCYSQDELNLCIMIANRFTDGNLYSAASKLNAFRRNDMVFPSEDVREFIREIDSERISYGLEVSCR